MTFAKPILAVLAFLLLVSCDLTKQVQQIVDESNAAVISTQLGDGEKSAEQILKFIEENPDLKGVNQRLLIRLSAVYLADKKPTLARAMLDQAYAAGNVDHLGERDQMLLALRDPLTWLHTLGGSMSATEMSEAPGKIQTIRNYRKNTILNDQLMAFVLEKELFILRSMTNGFRDEQSTEQVQALRDTAQTTLTAYTNFWSDDVRRGHVNTLRRAAPANGSCVKDPGQLDLKKLEAEALPAVSILRHVSVTYCEVELTLNAYGIQLNRPYRFSDAADSNMAAAQADLMKPLETPDWMNCVNVAKKKFNCSPTPTQD